MEFKYQKCFLQALKKDPDNTKALFRRVQALIKDGNTTKAREDLTKLTAKDPDGKDDYFENYF